MEMFLRGEEANESAENNGDPSTTTTMIMSGSNSNIIFLSSPSGNVYYGGASMRTTNQVLTLQSLDGDIAKAERKRRLEVAVEDTSFIVKSGDIILHHDIDIDIDDDDDNQHDDDSNDVKDVKDVGDDKGGSEYEEDIDIEHGIESSITVDVDDNDNNAELRLPSSFVITNSQQKQTEHTKIIRRNVPAVCAICLGNYEVGDRVTCSPFPTVVPVLVQNMEEEETQQTSASTTATATITTSEESSSSSSSSLSLSCCSHAFHRDCIIQWCAKKNNAQPDCPVCRRTFCTVIPLTTADLITLNNNNNNNNNNAAGTTSSSTTATTTTTESLYTQNTISSSINFGRQIPMIALPVNNTSDRMVMILPTPDMTVFHGHHHHNYHNHRQTQQQQQQQQQHRQSANTTTTTTTTEDSNTSTARDHR